MKAKSKELRAWWYIAAPCMVPLTLASLILASPALLFGRKAYWKVLPIMFAMVAGIGGVMWVEEWLRCSDGHAQG